ncbi:S-adenosyl-L-methionine-dependent methyltransferase [Scheffersomyces coipomensis]|uniref:S-adenosyl-L-methionine-dependent methyltransferase n=1 Tax=Scheffersomyces coipomensis TaxID=1788519 RepID=UPI00315DD43E
MKIFSPYKETSYNFKDKVFKMNVYFESEKFLKPSGAKGSLQSRIFNDTKLKNSPKHIYALVYSTLKYKEYIETVIKKSKIKDVIKTKKLKMSDELLILLVHDLIFSQKGRIQMGNHPIKDAILKNKTRLQAEFTKLKLKHKVKSVDELPVKIADEDESPVRWFRINTILTTPEAFFKDHEFFRNLQPVSSIEELKQTGVIYQDDYITNLYGVHPRERVTSTPAYEKGQVIIQDRASCFPAHILNQNPNDIHKYVIDACAAPGNKTTHCASFLPIDSTDAVIYAFERDSKRVEILKTMCGKALGQHKKNLIQITHADFTSTDPNDFKDVTGMVVDPSCSGSGIFGRALEDSQKEENGDQEIDTERLNKLAGFQFKIVKHSMKFPSARKVVYSTCSIHPHENERVVVDLLSDPELKKLGWKLDIRANVIPSWERRGWKEEFTSLGNAEECEKLAGGCVRSIPKEDGGIGFFAACFIKGAPGNETEADKKEVIEDVIDKQEQHEAGKEEGQNEEDEDEDVEDEAEDWEGFD